LAFVFTDVVGSTALLRAVGDVAFDELLGRCRTIIRDAAAPRGGLEVGTEGDGMFLVFRDAADALGACVNAQLALRTETWNGAAPTVRMGVHVGDGTAVADGTDYVGMGVHQAARIASAWWRADTPLPQDVTTGRSGSSAPRSRNRAANCAAGRNGPPGLW